jgi:uncharacterized protein
MGTRRLSLGEARRLAVLGQGLGGSRAAGVGEAVSGVGMVQRDPTSAVAPTEHLVLLSRIGPGYEQADLDRAAYVDRLLVEYWVHLVPRAQLGLHVPTMRRYLRGGSARAVYARGWLAQNASFCRYVLAELRRRGPLRSRDLQDRAVVPWRSGGWNDGKNLSRLLDLLWFSGRITIAGRDGRERVWDLTDRQFDLRSARLPKAQVSVGLVERDLRAAGVASAAELGRAFDRRDEGADRALARLVRTGVAIPCRLESVPGLRYAHAEAFEREWIPRVELLSPFDQLIYHRSRAKALFGFDFRLEMYLPPGRRQWGYYVLPILHGERMIGRIDPRFDPARQTLTIHATHAEPCAQGEGPAAAAAIHALASWLGAQRVLFERPLPPKWSRILHAIEG